MSDGKYAWSIKFDSYVAAAMQTIKHFLSADNRELKSGKQPHKGPLPHGYKPELDVTDECNPEHVYRFKKPIGTLRWAVELGKIDVKKSSVAVAVPSIASIGSSRVTVPNIPLHVKEPKEEIDNVPKCIGC